MSIGTLSPPRRGRNGKAEIPNPQSPIPDISPPPVIRGEQMIQLDLVDRSPYQTRPDPEGEELDRWRARLRENGQLNAIMVRRVKPPRYELIAGHSRVAAARAEGWSTIRANLVECNDWRASVLVMADNEQRKDLDDIARARWYQAEMQRRGCGPSDLARQLAAEGLPISQGQISNLVGLLKLPEQWQARVISRELPHTVARHVIPIADRPAVLKRLEKAIQGRYGRNRDEDEPLTAESLRNEIAFIMRREGADVERSGWGHFGRVPPLNLERLDQATRETLDIVDLGDGELYAMNKPFFEKLWSAHEKAHETKAAKKVDHAAAKKTAAEIAELTPAQKKQYAEQEKIRADKNRAQKRKRIEELAVNALRFWTAGRIRDQTLTSPDELIALATEAAIDTWASRYNYHRDGHAADFRRQPKGAHPADLACAFLGDCFFRAKDGGPCEAVHAADVRRIAGELGIDIQAAWDREQLGPLSASLWNTLGKDRVLAALKAAGEPLPPGGKRDDLVAAIVAVNPIAMPPEVAAAFGLKKKGTGDRGQGAGNRRKAKEVASV